VGYLPDDDARALGTYLRKFFADQSPESEVRAAMESATGHDPVLWRRCASEIGLQGLGIAESFGGAGAGLTELGVAFEELGRALVCGPFLSTLGLAVPAITRACDRADAEPLLSSIAAGDTIATLAWAGVEPALSTLRVRNAAITGTTPIVVDAVAADLLLVAARDGDGRVGVYRVHPGASELSRESLVALDSTRRLACVTFTGTPAECLALDAAPALAQAFDTARLLLAAEQLGGAQRVLESAVDYARTRVQFGRVIGSFQSVKHRCADMLVDVELARSLVYSALAAAQADPSALRREAAMARAFVSDAYVRLAADNLQIHGGIGFTWEHNAHLYLKRAKSTQHLFGSPAMHRRQLAAELGIPGGAQS
jgi:alkylation response protein AidB-like acyl-CoA dehydrogenase